MLTSVCIGHLRAVSQCLRTQARRNIAISAVLCKKAAADLDPIQQLFAQKAREYGAKQKAAGGGLVEPSPDTQASITMELGRVKKQFNIKESEDMTQFPTLKFGDKPIETQQSSKTQDVAGDLPF